MRLVPLFLNRGNINREIEAEIRRRKGIIYGARSIQKQIGGIYARGTEDYDVFVNNPRQAAVATERKIERFTPKDEFFVKKGINPGTWKLKHKGADGLAETQDDIGIADFTFTPRPSPRFNVIDGLRYRKLREEAQAKKMSLADKRFAFRHKKDREDLERINLFGFRRSNNPITRRTL